MASVAVSAEIHLGGTLGQRSWFRIDDRRYSAGRPGRRIREPDYEPGAYGSFKFTLRVLMRFRPIVVRVWIEQLLQRCTGPLRLHRRFRRRRHRYCDLQAAREAITSSTHLIPLCNIMYNNVLIAEIHTDFSTALHIACGPRR